MQNLTRFWKLTPALHIGLSLLLGTGIAYYPWLAIATLPLLVRRSAVLIPVATIVALATMPPTIEESIHGNAYFSIDSVKRHYTPFSSCYCYTGTVRSIGGIHNASARLYSKKKGYPANCSYIIPGATLSPTGVLTSKSSWNPVPYTFSLAEYRYQLKNRVKKHLRKHYKGPTYKLLAALATGDVESRQLRYYFTQIGLAHLIAISGFHFALLAALLAAFCKRPLLIIIALALYAIYIGPSPSLSRAHIAISLFLLAKVLYLRTTPLNALGAALTVALIADPHIVAHIGFQLSFMATFGILLFFRPCERALRSLLPARRYATLEELSLLDKHAYLLSATLRNTFALTIAVHCALLPILLYHFHTFPLLSLLYNLFIPFLITIPLVLLFFPFLSPVNTVITNALLTVTTYPPKKYAFAIQVASMPEWLLLSIVSLSMFVGIVMQNYSIFSRVAITAPTLGLVSAVPRRAFIKVLACSCR